VVARRDLEHLYLLLGREHMILEAPPHCNI